MSEDLFRIYLDAGLDGYPAEWHDTIKHLVRAQAGNRCIRCGHPYNKGMGKWSPCDEKCSHRGPWRWRPTRDEEWKTETGPLLIVPVDVFARNPGSSLEAEWRILTVHHLSGVKLDCRWWNLAALCQRCHLTIQGKVYLERKWDRPHSEWFKPYAAGWYASRYLDEELTRAETMERLEELLALELRQAALW